MARIDTLTNFLTDIAAAIKAKKGDDTAIPAANFDTEIANLTLGGGEGGGDNTMLISLIDRTATSFEIPEGTTRIGEYAFKYCTGLTSITIPDGITIIGSSALTEIDFSTHTTVPTLNSTTAFNNTSASLVIKVPLTLLDEWKAATNWSTYADKIVGV